MVLELTYNVELDCVLELARKVELDVLEVLLCHREHVARVGEEHIATVAVLRHVLILAFLELIKLFSIVALYPARFVQVS